MLLDKTNLENFSKRRLELLTILSAAPKMFYYPKDESAVDRFISRNHDPRCTRLIMNFLPSCLSSAAHVQSYHDLNWQPREASLQLWLMIRLQHKQSPGRLLEEMTTCAGSSKEMLLMKLLKESSLLIERGKVGRKNGYGLQLGDSFGDHMLLSIITYL
jgi:hypothetical protein